MLYLFSVQLPRMVCTSLNRQNLSSPSWNIHEMDLIRSRGPPGPGVCLNICLLVSAHVPYMFKIVPSRWTDEQKDTLRESWKPAQDFDSMWFLFLTYSGSCYLNCIGRFHYPFISLSAIPIPYSFDSFWGFFILCSLESTHIWMQGVLLDIQPDLESVFRI